MHYQHIIRRERAETARARTFARMMEAERDTARESVIKIAGDQRKLMDEHLELKCQVAEPNSPGVQEKGRGRKRKRGCLTVEALSRLQKKEAEVPAIEGGTRDDLTDSTGTRASDDGVDEKPPMKKFRLQKRVWTPGRGGEGALPGTGDEENSNHD
jgi:hypothetical protein